MIQRITLVLYRPFSNCYSMATVASPSILNNMFACSQRPLDYFAFKYFGLERTWWRFFQKRVVRTKFYDFIIGDQAQVWNIVFLFFFNSALFSFCKKTWPFISWSTFGTQSYFSWDIFISDFHVGVSDNCIVLFVIIVILPRVFIGWVHATLYPDLDYSISAS